MFLSVSECVCMFAFVDQVTDVIFASYIMAIWIIEEFFLCNCYLCPTFLQLFS